MADRSISIPGVPSGVFPNELLHMIKESIPHSDLRTHVCYYHTCKTIAGFYGDDAEQAAFWRRACLLSGICFSRSDSSYKDVAFEVISADGFCAHPDCGGELLEKNARAIEKARDVFGWDPEDEDFDERVYFIGMNQTHNFPPEPWMNRILSKIAFSDQLQQFYPGNEWEGDYPHLHNTYPIHLRRSYTQDETAAGANDLEDVSRRRVEYHPLVWRSMATFPATSKLSFNFADQQQVMYPVEHPPPLFVNVSDVVHAISNRLDDELTVEQLWYMLRTQFDMLMPDSKAFTLDELKRYQTLRGLAAQCRLDDFIFMSMEYEEHGLPFTLLFASHSEVEEPDEFYYVMPDQRESEFDDDDDYIALDVDIVPGAVQENEDGQEAEQHLDAEAAGAGLGVAHHMITGDYGVQDDEADVDAEGIDDDEVELEDEGIIIGPGPALPSLLFIDEPEINVASSSW